MLAAQAKPAIVGSVRVFDRGTAWVQSDESAAKCCCAVIVGAGSMFGRLRSV